MTSELLLNKFGAKSPKISRQFLMESKQLSVQAEHLTSGQAHATTGD